MKNYSFTYTLYCNFFIISFLFLFYFFQLVFHATFVIVYTFSEVVFSNLLFTIFRSLLSTILFTHTHTHRHTHKLTLNMGCYGPTNHRPSHITRFLQPSTGFILSSRRKFVPSKCLFLTHKHHSIVSFI